MLLSSNDRTHLDQDLNQDHRLSHPDPGEPNIPPPETPPQIDPQNPPRREPPPGVVPDTPPVELPPTDPPAPARVPPQASTQTSPPIAPQAIAVWKLRFGDIHSRDGRAGTPMSSVACHMNKHQGPR